MLNEIGDAVGIEIEFPSCSISGSWPNKKVGRIPLGWRLERDGSCTKDRITVDGVGVRLDDVSIGNYIRTEQTGGELVSPIFSLTHNLKKLRQDVELITDLLGKSGEYISTLSSTHVHVYFGNLPPVHKFKSLLEICRRIEAPLFKLSVAELHEHRGVEHNDYMYCRPIMGEGPQYVVDRDGYWSKCFDLEKLLTNARSSEEIMRGWGRADSQRSKWVPPRYYWVNPCPLVNLGTIEFRAFNQTLDPDNIIAWTYLSAAIVKTAYTSYVDLSNPLFPLGLRNPETETATYHFEDIFRVIDPKHIPDDAQLTLEKLWSKSPWQLAIKGPQINHLSRRGDSVSLDTVGNNLRADMVSKSFIDEIWENGYYD